MYANNLGHRLNFATATYKKEIRYNEKEQRYRYFMQFVTTPAYDTLWPSHSCTLVMLYWCFSALCAER